MIQGVEFAVSGQNDLLRSEEMVMFLWLRGSMRVLNHNEGEMVLFLWFRG